MHAIDVAFGGDSETTQVFRIGEASCAVPGAAAGLEAVHRAYGRLPWRDPPRARDRAGAERRRGLAPAGAPARDPRPDPAAHRRGPARLQPRRRVAARARATRSACPISAPRSSRSPPKGAAALYRGELARAIVRTVGEGGGAITERDLGGLPRRLAPPGARRLPRARGDLQPAALVGRDPHRLRPGAARARGPRRSRERRVDRIARRGDARADARSRQRASRAASTGAGSPAGSSPPRGSPAASRGSRRARRASSSRRRPGRRTCRSSTPRAQQRRSPRPPAPDRA